MTSYSSEDLKNRLIEKSKREKANKAIQKQISVYTKQLEPYEKFSTSWYTEFLVVWIMHRRRLCLEKKSATFIRPDAIPRKASEMLAYMEWSTSIKSNPTLQFEVKDIAIKLGKMVQEDDLYKPPRQAKILPFKRAMRIARKLWSSDPSNRSKKVRRLTALMVRLCAYTGSRIGTLFTN